MNPVEVMALLPSRLLCTSHNIWSKSTKKRTAGFTFDFKLQKIKPLYFSCVKAFCHAFFLSSTFYFVHTLIANSWMGKGLDYAVFALLFF